MKADSRQLDATAVICTRNRGASAVHTIDSLLACTSASFEIVVIDQSTDSLTRDALAPYVAAHAVRYIPSDTVGSGRSRNIGVASSTTEFVLMTDDDCIVAENWASEMIRTLRSDEKIGLSYSDVLPGVYEGDDGFIPTQLYETSKAVSRPADYVGGLGAGMAMRKSAMDKIGGFDSRLGGGTDCKSGEEYDIAMRLMRIGYVVYQTNATNVVHNGYRDGTHTRKLLHGYSYGTGVADGKQLGARYSGIYPVILRSIMRQIGRPLLLLLKTGRPQGAAHILHYLRGVKRGAGMSLTSPDA